MKTLFNTGIKNNIPLKALCLCVLLVITAGALNSGNRKGTTAPPSLGGGNKPPGVADSIVSSTNSLQGISFGGNASN
ncbi:hypothetical protein [Ferruginibacter sp.]